MGRPRVHVAITKRCAWCGKKFECTTPYAITKKRFCDHACRGAWHGDSAQVDRISRKCRTCGTKMEVLPCFKDSKHYCSNECRGADPQWREKISGENASQWSGGNDAYWKRQARQRDGRCTHCGKKAKGKELHAHHIVPAVVNGDHSLENLASLCNVCHQTVEKMFWDGLLQVVTLKQLHSIRNDVRSKLKHLPQ